MDNFKRDRRLHPQLYIGQLSSGDQGWSAYLHPSKLGYTKDTIDLDRAFKERGSYLFSSKEIPVLGKEMADHLVTFVQNYIKTKYETNNSCLLWSRDFNNNEGIYSMGFFNGKLTSPAKFPVSSSLTLHWEKDCSVSYDPAKKCISIKEPAGLNGAMGIAKDYPNGKDFPFQETRLSFDIAGTGCLELGCLEFDLLLSLQGDFDELDFGLRYFAYDKEKKTVCSQRYPLLSQEGSNVNMKVRMDPTSYLNPDRSFWAFAQASPPLPSSFVTTTGRKVLLTPVSAACPSSSAPARMVFARKSEDSNSDDFYLVPLGDFTMGIQDAPRDATSFDLLCGLEGMESIAFCPKSPAQQVAEGSEGDILRFISDKPAYAPAFGSEDDLQKSDGDLLTNKLTTSWIAVLPGGGRNQQDETMPALPVPRYNSQPNGAPLYIGGERGVLEFYQPGTDLTSSPDLSYPLVPYSHVVPDPADGFGNYDEIRRFEVEVLSPARRREIRSATRSMRSAATGKRVEDTRAATPQGFIMTVRGDGSYSKVQLAHTGESDLFFTDVQEPLQNALQTNQLFLVATGSVGLGKPDTAPDSAENGGPRFQNLISIDDWKFRVRLPEKPEPGNYSNVVVLKFCRKSLSEMAKRPDLWTDPGEFNDPSQVQMVSDWLQKYIADAIAAGGTKDDPAGKSDLFAKFAEIALNPDWNGVLFLKVDIEILPQNLEGMFAGIDPGGLTAHHIGIEANKIDSKTAAISEESSVFGSIWYRDEGYTPDTGAECDFRVTEIKALFEKSAIKDFASTAMLIVNRLMDHPVLSAKIGQAYNSYNAIPFHGSCQKKEDGSTVYVLDADDDCSLYLDSNVLRKVEVVKAQMSTLEAAKEAGGKSVTRFDLQGFMDFAVLKYEPANAGAAKAFDLFSYGNDDGKDEVKKGLCFSGLGIDMSYTKGKEDQKEFSFDLSRVGFDPGKSTSREGSLVKQFGMRFEGMDAGADDAGPDGGGFVKVGTKGLRLSSPDGRWYGLRFLLDIGTLGELAGKAGLTSSLRLAWGAGAGEEKESYAAFVGIKLPGSEGVKLFDLQGFMKLSIGAVRLGVIGERFVMTLSSIALKLMGLLKIPPTGATSFYLFGDAGAGEKGLGWYAMYKGAGTG